MKLFRRDDTTPGARRMWAVSIERLLDELARPRPLRVGRRLYRRDVAIACVPALAEIGSILCDETASVRPAAMRRLRDFLTDGASSPFYGDEPRQAGFTARELAVAFVVPAHAAPLWPALPAAGETRAIERAGAGV